MQHLPEVMQDTISPLAVAIRTFNFKGASDAMAHLENQLGANSDQAAAIQDIAYRRLLSDDPEWCERVVAELTHGSPQEV